MVQLGPALLPSVVLRHHEGRTASPRSCSLWHAHKSQHLDQRESGAAPVGTRTPGFMGSPSMGRGKVDDRTGPQFFMLHAWTPLFFLLHGALVKGIEMQMLQFSFDFN
ncbi:hypothetical protein EJB05_41942, partial [Eragrostis curvula]